MAPLSLVVTDEIMEAACDLARWAGREQARIYATLSETPFQRIQRQLFEFLRRRGGEVFEREVMQSFKPLKNDKQGAELHLDALVKARFGEWIPHQGERGRVTRKFRLFQQFRSTDYAILRGKNEKSVDVDAPIYPATTTNNDDDDVELESLDVSTSTDFAIHLGKTEKSVDSNPQKQADPGDVGRL